ncbi:MAG: PEP-CTERM sorting domain-containing protein [bacterium]|nr:PEP-CTERM sorting domain-containing protein [bacterium]
MRQLWLAVLCTLFIIETGSAFILGFDNIPADQTALDYYGGIYWDNAGSDYGWGFGTYNTTNSTPYSGSNYVLNRGGKNFLGFTFEQTSFFNGAFFSSTMANAGAYNYMANRVRLHYYDYNQTLICSSNWVDVSLTPTWIGAGFDVSRVVVEHDTDNPLNNGFGLEDAEWFSMDHVVYNEAPAYAPPGFSSTSPVPEPATALLLAIGLSLAAVYKRGKE